MKSTANCCTYWGTYWGMKLSRHLKMASLQFNPEISGSSLGCAKFTPTHYNALMISSFKGQVMTRLQNPSVYSNRLWLLWATAMICPANSKLILFCCLAFWRVLTGTKLVTVTQGWANWSFNIWLHFISWILLGNELPTCPAWHLIESWLGKTGRGNLLNCHCVLVQQNEPEQIFFFYVFWI